MVVGKELYYRNCNSIISMSMKKCKQLMCSLLTCVAAKHWLSFVSFVRKIIITMWTLFQIGLPIIQLLGQTGFNDSYVITKNIIHFLLFFLVSIRHVKLLKCLMMIQNFPQTKPDFADRIMQWCIWFYFYLCFPEDFQLCYGY